jgi:hypothetical protein
LGGALRLGRVEGKERKRQPKIRCSVTQQLRVCNNNKLRVSGRLLAELNAEIRADARGLPGGERDSLCH